MDESIFDDVWAVDKPSRSRSKPQKRMWREIEAVKEKQRLRKELEGMDLLDEYSDEDLDF